jgi:hypothetical protein
VCSTRYAALGQYFGGLCSNRYAALGQFFLLVYAALVMQHSVSCLVV